jgi:hypothetical protein
MDMFEEASRLKLRFDSGKGGLLSSEDLWDLPLEDEKNRDIVCLDKIAMNIHALLQKTEGQVSFVPTRKAKTSAAGRLQLMLDILKRVIEVKAQERDEREKQQERAALKQTLLGIIANKKRSALENETIEDLEKRLAAL